MRKYSYKLLNVFAETTFGGNPLCLFGNGEVLTNYEMQQIAKQFNLSETVFVFKSETADAKVRIFTTYGELPFAGHPILGVAYALKTILNLPDNFSIECNAGIVQIEVENDLYKLISPSSNPTVISPGHERAKFAQLIGLTLEDLADDPKFVNTGNEQLLIPVKDVNSLNKLQLDSDIKSWITTTLGRVNAYIFCVENNKITARYFSLNGSNIFVEDPGTGSACANLGAWMISQNTTLPGSYVVNQGEFMDRPCRLELELTEDKKIKVGGRVLEIGRGEISI